MSHSHWRVFGLTCAFAFIFSSTVRAQVIQRTSWLMQDLEKGLQQPLARQIIERSNDWLTRDNPNVPTARLDDPLRVTVVDEWNASRHSITTRLAAIQIGTIVLDTSLEQILGNDLIRIILTRNYYWHGEIVEETNPAFGSFVAPPPAPPLSGEKRKALEQPAASLSLEQITLRLPQADLGLFVAPGNSDLALPSTSYGRLRAGVDFTNSKVWLEVPLPIGNNSGGILRRGLEATFGAGASINAGFAGGQIVWGDMSRTYGTPPLADSTSYILQSAGTIFGRWENAIRIGDAGMISLVAGAGFKRIAQKPRTASNEQQLSNYENNFLKVASVEYHSAAGSGIRDVSLGLLGNALTAHTEIWFGSTFGLLATGAVNGILGTRPAYLPAFSLLVSPVVNLW